MSFWRIEFYFVSNEVFVRNLLDCSQDYIFFLQHDYTSDSDLRWDWFYFSMTQGQHFSSKRNDPFQDHLFLFLCYLPKFLCNSLHLQYICVSIYRFVPLRILRVQNLLLKVLLFSFDDLYRVPFPFIMNRLLLLILFPLTF